jgi:3-dehydroquinate synthase
MSERVRVALGGRSYEILIGGGLLDSAGGLIRQVVTTRRLVVVTDDNVAPLHLARLQAALDSAGFEAPALVVPAGEASKDLHRFPGFAEQALDLGIDRNTVLVAFGGGVVGDLTGFLAAVLLRGIDFVQIPTTLLAQIDSSVGGKTGTDTRQGKNLVGAFHQPKLVIADLDLLGTLPPRELRAGYAEMVKYGLLGDASFFAQLEREVHDLLALDPARLGRAVAHCCQMKADIVSADERESGQRALLNLGHTFGHALEAETGFGGALLHGEAIAIGMVQAAELSRQIGRLDQADVDRIQQHLASAGLPTRMEQILGHPFSADRLLQHMAHDKKASAGRLTFILLDAIGRASIEKNVDPEAVCAVLRAGGAVE